MKASSPHFNPLDPCAWVMVCCRRRADKREAPGSELESEMQQLLSLWEATVEARSSAESTKTWCQTLAVVVLLLDAVALYYPGLEVLRSIASIAIPAMITPAVSLICVYAACGG